MHQNNAITVTVRLTPSSSTTTVTAVRLKTEAVIVRSEAFNIVQFVYQTAACD
jgi:hypothetical protein